MTRDEHKKFLQQQVVQIKANLCDSKLTVEAEELKQTQLMQSLYAVGGALEALAKEEENEKDAPHPANEDKSPHQELVRELKAKLEESHQLPPHVLAMQHED